MRKSTKEKKIMIEDHKKRMYDMRVICVDCYKDKL